MEYKEAMDNLSLTVILVTLSGMSFLNMQNNAMLFKNYIYIHRYLIL